MGVLYLLKYNISLQYENEKSVHIKEKNDIWRD